MSEILFLIKKKGLVLNENNSEQYFKAFLWGTEESPDKKTVLIFYNISYENGEIVDAEFNFVERSEFDKTYQILA